MRDVYLLQFEFTVTQAVTGLHFYQGVYWTAVLREFLRKYIPEEYKRTDDRDFLSEMGIYPLALTKGIKQYLPGEKIYFNLIYPTEFMEILLKAMRNIISNKYHDLSFPLHSKFYPGRNVHLNSIKCLISQASKPEKWQALNSSFLTEETTALLHKSKELTLVFYTPLRLHRPNQSKERPWIDPMYWDSTFFLQRLSESLAAGIPEGDIQAVQTVNRGLIWIDVYDGGSPLAGMCGAIRLRLPGSEKLYRMLVEGQYIGIGKNRSLGLGFYYIAESPQNPLAKLPENAATLLSIASNKALLHSIKEKDLLIEIANTLYTAIEEQIPMCIYSFRRNKSYLDAISAVHNGFRKGIKTGIATEIDAFFDSIDTSILSLQLQGLFGPDPIYALINKMITLKAKGIEPENPLYKLLSDIHLLPLDRELGRSDFHYVRFAGSFVLMDKQHADPVVMLLHIQKTLSLMNLKLSEENTSSFGRNDEITFLERRIKN
jgi:hypothetical protein